MKSQIKRNIVVVVLGLLVSTITVAQAAGQGGYGNEAVKAPAGTVGALGGSQNYGD